MALKNKENSLTPLITLFLLSLFAFEIIAWDWWRHGPSSLLDVVILRHTEKLVSLHPWGAEFFTLVGILGQSLLLWSLVIGGGLFLAWKKDWPGLILLLIIVLLGNQLIDPVKDWFQRPRPVPGLPGARGYSFPSSSTYLAAVVYGALAALASRHFSKWYSKFALYLGALAAVILVGLSRLALRLHWLTDVFGAYALASAWLLLNILIYRKIRQKLRR